MALSGARVRDVRVAILLNNQDSSLHIGSLRRLRYFSLQPMNTTLHLQLPLHLESLLTRFVAMIAIHVTTTATNMKAVLA